MEAGQEVSRLAVMVHGDSEAEVARGRGGLGILVLPACLLQEARNSGEL